MSETTFQRYVRLKTGEAMTGKPSSLDEVDTDATRWGILHEIDFSDFEEKIYFVSTEFKILLMILLSII